MTKPPVENPLLAEARHLRLKKRFAQNFLVDESALARIAEAARLTPDETVLEIGPGSGFLTEKLLEKSGQVVAVELDRRMAAYLRQKFQAASHFKLIEQDILRFDFEEIEAPRFTVVGNLPYNLTSPILFRLAGELHQAHYPLRQRIRQATVMVQKEVGERITALPGDRRFNALSIAIQYWFSVRLEFILPSRAFFPAPKVESAVITLTPREAPLVPVDDLDVFSRMIRTAFNQRRKTLKNALAPFAEAAVLVTMFRTVEAQFGPLQSLRAEAVSIEAMGALANAYTQHTR